MARTEPPAPLPTAPRNRSWRGWWRFVVLGAGGYLALTLGVIALVEGLGLGERPAYALVIVLVMAGNFYANRRFVFPAGRTGAPARQALRFLVAAITFRGLEFGLFSALIGPCAMPYVYAIALTSALSFGVKYYVFARWVFR